jgi:hypothetical protein
VLNAAVAKFETAKVPLEVKVWILNPSIVDIVPPVAFRYAREESITVIALLVAIGVPKLVSDNIKLNDLDAPVGTVGEVLIVIVFETLFIAIEPVLEPVISALPEV